MSVSMRLIVLVGSALLGMVLLVSVATYETDAVYQETNYSNVNVIPSMLVLNQAMLSFSQIRVRTYRHALNTDQAAMQDLDGKIQEARLGVEKALKDYESLTSGGDDKRLLEADQTTYSEYAKGLDSTLEASRHDKKDDARDLLTKHAGQAEAFNSALVDHMKFNRELGVKSETAAAARKARAVNVSVGIAALALLIMGGFGYLTYRYLISSIANANEIAKRIAAGDLREESLRSPIAKDEIGQLLGAMQKMRADLADTIRHVVDNAREVASSAENLSSTADQVAVSTERQSSSAASAAASVEELTVSIDHIGSGADDANGRAKEARELAVHGGKSVDGASVQIAEVASRIEHTAEQLQKLSAQVQQIGGISAVIRDVADQTNLLALNAAIEAARAGEQGRGFAVVADEVRKLAERTTKSVQEISTVIGAIEEGAEAAVDSMQTSRAVVGDVVESAKQAATSMTDICTSADTVRSSVSDISAALQEQRAASTELAKSVEAMAQMSEENAAAVSSVSATAHQLVSVSDALRNGVARFHL
ncbi:methyl-accepting chemotaxis protein [Uliginosibacterium gangwonense]|uniref:methyl-accepting chemotaxis protein n=1 Tax=Uliginosibacterium gangwonense TaxID=392736 RepID=UPI000363EFFF|nr:methyl-accepting chemotaxis protein [Uliginosibacterium gangwonense]